MSIIIIAIYLFILLSIITKRKNGQGSSNNADSLKQFTTTVKKQAGSFNSSSSAADTGQRTLSGAGGIINNAQDRSESEESVSPWRKGMPGYKHAEGGGLKLKDGNVSGMEDRNHDWLAMQLKEEARMKRDIDREMNNLKAEHIKEHKKIHG